MFRLKFSEYRSGARPRAVARLVKGRTTRRLGEMQRLRKIVSCGGVGRRFLQSSCAARTSFGVVCSRSQPGVCVLYEEFDGKCRFTTLYSTIVGLPGSYRSCSRYAQEFPQRSLLPDAMTSSVSFKFLRLVSSSPKIFPCRGLVWLLMSPYTCDL